MYGAVTTQNQQDSEKIEGSIHRFFATFKLGTILNRCGIKKTKGIPAAMILMAIFSLSFAGKNIFRSMAQNPDAPFGKDVAYDFLKDPSFNWRKALLFLAVNILATINGLTGEIRKKVAIVDDSPYDRSRSKNVELLAKVYDHAAKKFIKGFRLLSVCWSDGVSLIPLDFALLSSREIKNRFQGITKTLDKRTCGYKRRLEALTKATDLLQSMMQRILSYYIRVDYILMDSWFAWPKVICDLHSCAPVICMLKKTSKVLYEFGGLNLDVKAIYRRLKKRPGRAGILTHAFVTISGGIPAKLVFVRDRRKKDWLVILSTDVDLPDEEIVQLYGRRWDIEVFFKMAKQHLKLVKEIQARDFDSLIAHTTIVFMRYQFLAYEQRIRADKRTFGQLFHLVYDEVADITFLESLHRILSMAIDKLRSAGEFSENAYRILIDTIMGEAVRFFGLDSGQCQRAATAT